jgi:hypothetical protein
MVFMDKKTCTQCNTPIEDASSAVERNGRTFCSESCANASQESERSGPNPPKTPVI